MLTKADFTTLYTNLPHNIVLNFMKLSYVRSSSIPISFTTYKTNLT